MSRFSDNSEEYRCCCEVCHVKTATSVIGIVEGCFLTYFLVNSIVIITTVSDYGGGLEGGVGSSQDPLVQGPFITAIIGIVVGLIFIVLLFFAISKKIPALLLPHFVLQIIALILFLGLIIVGIIAFSTNLTVFYRLLNAVAFTAPPEEDTVSLGTGEWVQVILCFTCYCFCFLLELVAAPVVWRCYTYLVQRREYVKYIQQYTMPMSSAPNHHTIPVPTYYHGNTLYLTAKRASDS